MTAPAHPKAHRPGVVFAVLSALIYTFYNLSIRFSEPYVNVWQIMFGRSLIGIAAMVIMVRWMKLDLWGRSRGMLVATGLSGMLGLTFMVMALFRLSLFEALVLFYLYPVFAALMSPWLVGERLTLGEWGLVGLAFGGMVVMLWSGESVGGVRLGHLFGLAAGCSYGLTLTLIRRLSDTNNVFTPVFYISVISAIVCAVPFFMLAHPFQIGARGLLAIVVISTLATAAFLAGNKALAHLPSPKMGVIGMFEIVLASTCGFILFDESVGWRVLIGAVLIIFSGIRLTLRSAGNPCDAGD